MEGAASANGEAALHGGANESKDAEEGPANQQRDEGVGVASGDASSEGRRRSCGSANEDTEPQEVTNDNEEPQPANEDTGQKSTNQDTAPQAPANQDTAPQAPANQDTAPQAPANQDTVPQAPANQNTARGATANESSSRQAPPNHDPANELAARPAAANPAPDPWDWSLEEAWLRAPEGEGLETWGVEPEDWWEELEGNGAEPKDWGVWPGWKAEPEPQGAEPKKQWVGLEPQGVGSKDWRAEPEAQGAEPNDWRAGPADNGVGLKDWGVQPGWKAEPNAQGADPTTWKAEPGEQWVEPEAQGAEPKDRKAESNAQGVEPKTRKAGFDSRWVGLDAEWAEPTDRKAGFDSRWAGLGAEWAEPSSWSEPWRPSPDGAWSKLIVHRGRGLARPGPGSLCRVLLTVPSSGHPSWGQPSPAAAAGRWISLRLGSAEGRWADALDAALETMAAGELALLRPSCCPSAAISVQLGSFSPSPPFWAVPPARRWRAVRAGQARAEELFSRGLVMAAGRAYSRALRQAAAAAGPPPLPAELGRLKAELHAGLASVQLSLGLPAPAAANAGKALALSPEHLEARYRRGLAQAAMMDLEAAMEDLGAVLRAQPGHSGARRELSRVRGAARERDARLARRLGRLFA